MSGQVTLLRRILPPSEWPQSDVPHSYSWATSPGARLRVGPRAWTGGRTDSFVCRPGSSCPAGPQTDTDPCSRLPLWELSHAPPGLSIGTKLGGVLLCRQYWGPGSSFQVGRMAWWGWGSGWGHRLPSLSEPRGLHPPCTSSLQT